MANEADWQHLRKLKPLALDRFCARILGQIAQASHAAGKSNHERYLAVFRLIERRDKDIARAFNDMRRSTALNCILAMNKLGLFTAEEIAGFSQGVRQWLGPDSEFARGGELE
jgi:hypothetical protein